jgi:hypothetical protein
MYHRADWTLLPTGVDLAKVCNDNTFIGACVEAAAKVQQQMEEVEAGTDTGVWFQRMVFYLGNIQTQAK